MKTTHPAFWGAGWAGMAVGGTLTLFGLTSLSEVAGVGGAYGMMVMGASLFLLAGLKVRERLLDRAESIRVHRVAVARLPQRPPTATFGEQNSAPATAPARAKTTT
jgi:hypothetical protein